MDTKVKSAAVRALGEIAGPLTFGGIIEAIRLGEEESLAQFAKRLGVSRSHLHDIEKGTRGVSLVRAVEWAQLLGYGPAKFIELAVNDAIAESGIRVEGLKAVNGNGKKSSGKKAARPASHRAHA